MFKTLDSVVHVGKHHVKRNIPCQDRAIATTKGEMVILAVADGMGSYEHAELGAEFTVNFVREHAKEFISALRIKENENEDRNFNKNIRAAMFDLQEGLINHARSLKISPDDLHCTLSFSIISPEVFMNVSIGDSPLYTLANDGPMFLDGNNNGAKRSNNNTTYSIVDMDYSIDFMGVQVGLTKNLRSVLITSDGAIGWSKQEVLLNENNFGDLPAWYYDMLRERKALNKVVEELVEVGHDDVGVAYYVHDKSLFS
jgi:hypothetical protein